MDQVTAANPLLEQMKDISLPPDIEFWPPAPWVLPMALLLFVLLSLLLWWAYRRFKVNRAKRKALLAPKEAALALLDNITLDDSESVLTLSGVLKRAALSYFPRDEVASLSGNAWSEFLARTLPPAKTGSHSFTLLHSHSYRQLTLSSAEADGLKAAARAWLSGLPASALEYNQKAEATQAQSPASAAKSSAKSSAKNSAENQRREDGQC
ncbi:DUF4381 family protein [Shewanella sp. JM162201]|uniref:DUF4381 family protein n=1 Tax=Shewanella jiangmenensis TaxID=2837387 RepID=A0ABS5V7A7_9GAMM|nr:DUF4381 domain-containing protein [Shewanella jiangmenensis]MBT1446319.1 DUF4381 family protein [Shewanella jiangmenensis]